MNHFGQKESRDYNVSTSKGNWFVINILIQTIIYLMIALYLINNDLIYLTTAIGLSVLFCIFFRIEDGIYLVFGLSIYENVFKIMGNNAIIVLLAIIIVKLLLAMNFRIRFRKSIYAFGILYIVVTEIFHDVWGKSLGQLIVNIVVIIFFFLILSSVEKLDLDCYSFIASLTSSFFFAVYYTINTYGGLSVYFEKLTSSFYAYRFGHTVGDTIGGAMAIPLYAITIISMSLALLLTKKKIQKGRMLFLLISMSFALLFGALTISRSFYVCIIVVFIVAFVNIYNIKRKSLGLVCTFLFGLIILCVFWDEIYIVVEKLLQRISDDTTGGSGGRVDIWLSCFEYLLDKPISFMLGLGANRYIEIGEELDRLFSAGAHNLFLDIWMSWGLIGLGIVLFIIISTIKRIGIRFKKCRECYLPIIGYILFAMTALRVSNVKTWLYLYGTIAFIKCIRKENIKG